MTAWLISKAPWIALGLALLGGGIWIGHEADRPAYARLQSQYAALQTQDAQNLAASEKAAADTLQAQILARNQTDANNAQVIATLHAQADSAADDLSRANRLLELAARENRAGGGAVPQAANQPGAATAGQAAGASDLARLLVATREECTANAGQLDALIAEIRPQL